MKKTINGYEFEPIPFTCPECGAIDDCTFTWKESNRSIQQRCTCGKWVGNCKYDPRPKSEKIADRVYKPEGTGTDINAKMKELMGLKDKLGEFSLDLYYNDVEDHKGTSYTAKLHWPTFRYNLHGYTPVYHDHHERAGSFDEALANTERFLENVIRQGKRLKDV